MTPIQLDWDAARETAHASARPLPTERVALVAAMGRTLAREIRAHTPLPPRDASAMDGWAVCGEPPWVVVGEVRAGDAHPGALNIGEAIRIATGAVMPPMAIGVLRTEAGSIDPDGRLRGDVSPGLAVRPAGEEAKEGELLIEAGRRLGPADIGLMASAGYDEVVVVRRPRARVFIFGDELLESGPARDGRIRDSLGPQLPGWLARFGVDVLDVLRVSDTMAAHVAALESCDDADIIVTTGGTAAGPVDFLHAAIEVAGLSLVVDSVACRPGHPMLLARSPRRWLIGLPGNPQAAIAGLFTVGQPLVAGMHGCGLPPLDSAEITVSVRGVSCTTRLIPCSLTGGRATPTSHIGSGMLRGLAAADAFAILTPSGCSAGETVPVLALG